MHSSFRDVIAMKKVTSDTMDPKLSTGNVCLALFASNRLHCLSFTESPLSQFTVDKWIVFFFPIDEGEYKNALKMNHRAPRQLSITPSVFLLHSATSLNL